MNICQGEGEYMNSAPVMKTLLLPKGIPILVTLKLSGDYHAWLLQWMLHRILMISSSSRKRSQTSPKILYHQSRRSCRHQHLLLRPCQRKFRPPNHLPHLSWESISKSMIWLFGQETGLSTCGINKVGNMLRSLLLNDWWFKKMILNQPDVRQK